MVFVRVEVRNKTGDKSLVAESQLCAPGPSIHDWGSEFDPVMDHVDTLRINPEGLRQEICPVGGIGYETSRLSHGQSLDPRLQAGSALVPLVPYADVRPTEAPREGAQDILKHTKREEDLNPAVSDEGSEAE
jgi:hypothetical protein